MLKKTILSLMLAAVSAGSFAADYYVVVPVPNRVAVKPVQPISVVLNSYSLPGGLVGTAYSYDFNSLLQVTGDASFSPSGVTWAVTAGTLPPGLTLNANTGVLSGTPTSPGLQSFNVTASYRTQAGQQSYQFAIDKIEVSLAPDTGYSTNFGSLFVNASSTQHFSFQNKGTLALTNMAGQVVGNSYTTITATTCGSSLAPGASCTFNVTYHPTVVDTLSAQLSVTSPQLSSPAVLALTGQSQFVLYSAGYPAASVFIKTTTGTSGTYLGTQTSTTKVPQITAGYLGGSSVGLGTPWAAQQIYLQSSTSSTATYLMAVWDTSAAPYTKMVQVTLTLNGNQAYASLTGARYTTTALVTGANTNLPTLWNAGTNQLLSTGGGGYGVAGLTVVGF